ncbi:putative germin-like protein 2-1 [Zingiber officinale]|uniref:putative germin-like protein 2-1 n=1 Tax=Zingiber officinale TaxID=94328 RepID=UPI001C4BAC20|nr:putative germin-like protein 2-1 [Zingiber officinale]
MSAKIILIIAASIAVISSICVSSSDPGLLQDFCVANFTSTVVVNGYPCKDPLLVTSDDFFFSGIDQPRSTDNQLGSNITVVGVERIPGLNTMGLIISRIDYAPGGLNPPHYHPRSSEVFTVVEGDLFVGFITTNSDIGNTLYAKKLQKGDVFVFPQGLIHFQFNIGGKRAVATAAFGSQSPGLMTVTNAVFGSIPPVPAVILAKAFQLNTTTIEWLQQQNWVQNFNYN